MDADDLRRQITRAFGVPDQLVGRSTPWWRRSFPIFRSRAALMSDSGGTAEYRRWLWRATPKVVVRPWLWRTALRFMAWPPWELGAYMKFRHQTAYGDSEGNPADVVPFLWWARQYPCTFCGLPLRSFRHWCKLWFGSHKRNIEAPQSGR